MMSMSVCLRVCVLVLVQAQDLKQAHLSLGALDRAHN